MPLLFVVLDMANVDVFNAATVFALDASAAALGATTVAALDAPDVVDNAIIGLLLLVQLTMSPLIVYVVPCDVIVNADAVSITYLPCYTNDSVRMVKLLSFI
jgi:hypothetical protein